MSGTDQTENGAVPPGIPPGAASPWALDARIMVAFLWAALVLATSEYWCLSPRVPESWVTALAPLRPDLVRGLLWVASTLVFFVFGPLFIVRVVFRDRLADYGWSPAGLRRHLPLYALLYAAMVPLIFLAAQRPEFTRTYPFVPSARTDRGVFAIWEMAYAVQFLAIEAFFRGYLLFTLGRRIGLSAAAVVAVPYTMIHFHKPTLECFGAVIAGTVLGMLALRFRSFWGGVLLHAAVAVTMDALSVHRSGLF